RIKFSLQVQFASQIILCRQPSVENVDSGGRTCIEICPEACRINDAAEIRRFEERYILEKTQPQPPSIVSAFEVNQLVKCVLIRVIDKQNRAGHVIQAQIASAASFDVAEAKG